jgi:cytosine/adenosine deaminase-related metal-dependent hydrolase
VLLRDGCVVYEDDSIIFVGFPDDPSCPKADTVIRTDGKLVSPGLINLHCIANIDLQPLRIDVGSVGFPRSKDWLEHATPIWSDEEFRVSANLSVASLLRSGNTTFCNVTTSATKSYEDPKIEPYVLAEASETLGARAYLAHNFQDHTRYSTVEDGKEETHYVFDKQAGEQGLENALEFVSYLKQRFDTNNSLVQGFLFPYTTLSCSDDLLQAASQAARQEGLVVRSHFAQNTRELVETLAERQQSPTERLASLGVLGPELTLTHAIFMRGHETVPDSGDLQDDLKLLTDSGTHVAHCPIVFSRRGQVLNSFQTYLDAGVNLALGTDTSPPDLLGEMRMAATLAKVVDDDPLAGTAASIYNAATLGGAKALGRDDLGKLIAGAKADISVFDLHTLHLGVIDDPIKALVHYASSGDTDRVIVDGRTVVEDKHVLGVSEDELLSQAQAAWDVYKQGLAARDPLGRDADTMYPPSFPVRGG